MSSSYDKGSNAENEINDKLKKSEELAQKVKDTVSEKTDEYAELLRDYIKKCPVKSVLTASLIGLAFGLFFIRK